jgi:DegV family protein with EDD domain
VTRLVIDSTCDLPDETLTKLNITMVPLKVHFGDEVYRDRIEISEAEFFDKLERAAKLPTTSQPSPGEFQEAYEKLPKDEPVISIHIASTLSGTVQSAKLAAEALPDREIHVVDSENVTWAAGLLVLAAAEAVKQGKSPPEILAMLEEKKKRARLVAALDTLKYVIMGGRLSRAQGMIGSMLRVKPIMVVQGGVIDRGSPARHWGQAREKLIEDIRAHGGAEGPIAVIQAKAPEELLRLRDAVARAFPDNEILTGSIGPVVATHGGPGAAGVAYIARHD